MPTKINGERRKSIADMGIQKFNIGSHYGFDSERYKRANDAYQRYLRNIKNRDSYKQDSRFVERIENRISNPERNATEREDNQMSRAIGRGYTQRQYMGAGYSRFKSHANYVYRKSQGLSVG